MNENLSTTTATTAVQVGESQVGLPLDAAFCYDPADPLAVAMVVESISGPVTWTFARELVLDGRFEPTGDGDVHVWPCLSMEGSAVVIVELCGPDGAILLQFPARAIDEFVASSLAAVAQGTEHLDVDGWIEQLLGGSDAVTP